MNWTNQSIKGYKELFGGFELDRTKYINSGFMVFNKEHRKFFEELKKMYYDNIDTFINLQDNKVKKGNDQTPINYLLQTMGIEVKTDLPMGFKLTHMHRKSLFGHNWQLKEDTTPYFIKYGYNWIFNGIPKNERTKLMKQVWDYVKHNYKDRDWET